MIIRILAIAFIFHHTTALMTVEEFYKNILNTCFEDALPKQSHTGFTIDNFIYLVEKYERKHPERNMLTNILTFLKEFNCDGIKYPLTKFNQIHRAEKAEYANERFKILKLFLSDELDKIVGLKDDFTEDEKCHLFFTLTHTVYKAKPLPKIHREGIDVTTVASTTETPNNQFQEETEVTVEQGVSSFDGNESAAISLGEVLYGILGALINKERKLDDFVVPSTNSEGKIFRSPFTFSLSALIAARVIYDHDDDKSMNEEENKWNSAECTKQYVMREKAKILTKANLLGSLDGFLMGKKLLETNNKLNIKLSQLLRMYYGQQIFSVKQLAESFCKRGSVFEDNNFKTNLKEQIKTYISYNSLTASTYSNLVVNEMTDKAVVEYFNFGPKVTSLKVGEERCKAVNISCETPSNIVVVLDKHQHFDDQLTTVAKLINKLNIEPDESSVMVLVNSEAIALDMEKIVDMTDNKAEATCSLAEYHNDDETIMDEGSVLEAINRTLMNIEQNLISLPGVPSKVVVYYNYGSSQDENKQLKIKIENARRELINKHRSVLILGVGEDTEHLKKLIKDHSLNIIDPRSNDLVENLKRRICSAPAEFQYQECKTRSQFNSEHLLHINPDGVQYWHMQPKYFYKSFGYKLKFKPENGNIRVCFNRKPDVKEVECQQTNEQKTEIEFSKRDPCKGSTAVTCDPFYFKISGLDDPHLGECRSDRDESSPDKPVCKRVNQIKVSFNHEGLACSNTVRQIGSLYQILMAIFVAVYIASRKS